MSGRRLVWVAVALAVALTWWSAQRAQQRLLANVVLALAETQGARIAAQGQLLEPMRRMLGTNIQTLREVVDAAPADARIPLAIGSHYLMLGNARQAAEWYRRALDVEPRPEIYLNLGRAALLDGDREGALDAFRKAVLIDQTLRRSVPEDLREELPPPPRPPS